ETPADHESPGVALIESTSIYPKKSIPHPLAAIVVQPARQRSAHQAGPDDPFTRLHDDPLTSPLDNDPLASPPHNDPPHQAATASATLV
ncbi:MAG: hypothetical protein ACRDLF_06915, partial [Solirubrobacteraceae bacterium]